MSREYLQLGESVRQYGKTLKAEYEYLNLCKSIATNSKCLSRQVGAILVLNNIVIGTGFNRSPVETKACKTCIRHKHNCKSGESLDLCKALHAEQIAILTALKKNVDLSGATLYVSTSPCYQCAKLIVECKIKKVVASSKYDSKLTDKLFKEAKVKLVILNGHSSNNTLL